MNLIKSNIRFIFRFAILIALVSRLQVSTFATESTSCGAPRCVSMDEMVTRAKLISGDSKRGMEKLFRARQNIKVKMGSILPHLNLGTAIGVLKMDPLDVIPSLIGFLFPSNWFDWKESILLYQAEKHSLIALMANQVNTAETIYLNVHREKIDQRIYLQYLSLFDEAVLISKGGGGGDSHSFEELSKDFPKSITLNKQGEMLEAIRSDIRSSYILLEQALKDIHVDLAMAVDMERDWTDFSIQDIALPDLNGNPDLEQGTLRDLEATLKVVVQTSPELKALHHMVSAARYAKKARFFKFLHPDAGPDESLGLGYIPSIRIGQSYVNDIKTDLEEAEKNLRGTLLKAADNIRIAHKLYAESADGQRAIRIHLQKLRADLLNHKDEVAEEYADALQLSMKFAFNTNFSQHLYLLAQSQIKRLLLSGSFYADLQGRVPRNEVPSDWNHRHVRLENREINRDIKAGRLQI